MMIILILIFDYLHTMTESKSTILFDKIFIINFLSTYGDFCYYGMTIQTRRTRTRTRRNN